MFARISAIAIFLAAFSFGTPLKVFALRSNDFTKANVSSEKKFSTDKSNLERKKAFMNERGTLDKQSFVTPDNADYLRNQKAYKPDNDYADSLSKNRDWRNKKSFDQVPEYTQIKKSDEWYKSENQVHLDNADRDLSKKYLGKIDTTKRNLYEQDYLREHYEEMLDMSLQDLNKYYFRESRPRDAGIPTQVAGKDLKGDESDGSILDFLSKDRTIKREPISVRGPKTSSQPVDRSEVEGGQQPKTPAQKLPVSSAPPSSSGVKLAPPLINRSGDSSSNTAQADKPRKKVKSVESVDPNSVKGFQFMNLPENMRGETTIKVEVQEDDF